MLSYFQLNICSENFQVQHENGHTLSILWQLLFEKVLLLWGNLTENNSKIKEIFRRKNKSTHNLNNIHIKPCPRFDSAPSNWWGGGGGECTHQCTTPAPKKYFTTKEVLSSKYMHFELRWQTRLPFWRLFKFESTSISTWILLSKASKASVRKNVHSIIKMCLR